LPLNKLRPPAYVGNGVYPYPAGYYNWAGYPYVHPSAYYGGYYNYGHPYRYSYSKSPSRYRGDPLLDYSY
jgi:hypothetical protein